MASIAIQTVALNEFINPLPAALTDIRNDDLPIGGESEFAVMKRGDLAHPG